MSRAIRRRYRHRSLQAAPLSLPVPKLATSVGAAIIEGTLGAVTGLLTGSLWKAIDKQANKAMWSERDDVRGDGYRVGFTVAAALAGLVDGFRRGQVYHD